MGQNDGTIVDQTAPSLTEEGATPERIPLDSKEVFTVSNHYELLELAQRKFDCMRRKNKELTKDNHHLIRGRTKLDVNDENNKKVNQLLSSLLYLSLMAHKVDDMKKILEQKNNDSYREWQGLFSSLHSPLFHLRERRMHNNRAKKIYSRKCHYKTMYQNIDIKLEENSVTSRNLSGTLSKITEEHHKIQQLLQTKNGLEVDLAESRKEIENVRSLISTANERIATTVSENSVLNEQLRVTEIREVELRQHVKDATESLEKKEHETHDLREETAKLMKSAEVLRKDLTVATMEKLHDRAGFDKCVLDYKDRKNDLESRLEISLSEVAQLRAKMERDASESSKEVTTAKGTTAVVEIELKNTRDSCEKMVQDLILRTKERDRQLTNQAALQEMLNSKDKDNRELNETLALRLEEYNILNASHHDATKSMGERISLLEEKLEAKCCDEEDTKKKAKQFESRVKEIQIENACIMSDRDKSKEDCTVLKETCNRLEEHLQTTKDYQRNVDAKQNLLQKEVMSLDRALEQKNSEKSCLTQKINLMTDKFSQCSQSAQDKSINAESKMSKMQSNIDLLKLEEERAKTEIISFEKTNKSLEKALSETLQLQKHTLECSENTLNKEVLKLNVSLERSRIEKKGLDETLLALKNSFESCKGNAKEREDEIEKKLNYVTTEQQKSENKLLHLQGKNLSLEKALSTTIDSQLSSSLEKYTMVQQEIISLKKILITVMEKNESKISTIHSELSDSQVAQRKSYDRLSTMNEELNKIDTNCQNVESVVKEYFNKSINERANQTNDTLIALEKTNSALEKKIVNEMKESSIQINNSIQILEKGACANQSAKNEVQDQITTLKEDLKRTQSDHENKQEVLKEYVDATITKTTNERNNTLMSLEKTNSSFKKETVDELEKKNTEINNSIQILEECTLYSKRSENANNHIKIPSLDTSNHSLQKNHSANTHIEKRNDFDGIIVPTAISLPNNTKLQFDVVREKNKDTPYANIHQQVAQRTAKNIIEIGLIRVGKDVHVL